MHSGGEKLAQFQTWRRVGKKCEQQRVEKTIIVFIVEDVEEVLIRFIDE